MIRWLRRALYSWRFRGRYRFTEIELTTMEKTMLKILADVVEQRQRAREEGKSSTRGIEAMLSAIRKEWQ